MVLVCETQGLALILASKDHDTTHEIMTIIRLWMTHSNLYCMYGMQYFGELTKLYAYVYVYGFRYFRFETEGSDFIAAHPPMFPHFMILGLYFDNYFHFVVILEW